MKLITIDDLIDKRNVIKLLDYSRKLYNYLNSIYIMINSNNKSMLQILNIIAVIGTLFVTIWTIIGGITLFTVGIRCMTYNYIIWQMGLGTVITFIVWIPLSIVLFFLAFYTA